MIDLHTHTLFSDGVLLPSELIQRAEQKGLRAICIADHADMSNLDFVVPRIVTACRENNPVRSIRAIPGVEITHVPPSLVAPLVARARELGAKLVLIHGESPVEPVTEGTNRAAIEAGADILTHPGMITEADARLAAERGISEGVLRAAGIHVDAGGRGYDGWWRLPYPHRSGVWKTRYRNPDPKGRPKYLDDPGAEFHLYNPLGLGPGEDEIWFTEGEFDTLALIDQGLKVIGIHGVSNVRDPDEDEQDGQPSRFRKSWLHLFTDTLCITMFDNDDEGRKAGRRLARGLDGEAFDEWPDGYGDVNEWHRDDPTGMARALYRYRRGLYHSKGLVPWE